MSWPPTPRYWNAAPGSTSGASAGRYFRVGHPIRVPTCGSCAGCGGESCAGKHPIPSRWERTIGSLPAVRSIWRPELGPRGIGLACGSTAGVWVLDVDPATGGAESLARLVAAHGPLPPTWRARTGSGGLHYFFRATAEIRNSAGQIFPGLDVRGLGGYVVLPPSPHRSGGDYSWLDVPLRGVDLADAPDWLTTLALLRPRRAGSGSKRNADGSLDRPPPGAWPRRGWPVLRPPAVLRARRWRRDRRVSGFALLRHHAVQQPPMDMEQAERDMRDVARRYPPTAPEQAA